MTRSKATGAVCVLLALGSPATASGESATTDVLPQPDEPATSSVEEETETDEAEEERRVERFVLPREPQALRSFPDAAPVLGSSDLFPLGSAQRFGEPSELVRVGKFAIGPSIGLGVAYDDFKQEGEDSEREITSSLSATLRAQSLFARHSLGFTLDTTINPFDRDEDQALIDWVFGSNGRLDLTRHSSLRADLTFTRGTESKESAEAVEAREETTVTSVAGTLSYNRQHRRLNWGAGGGVSRFTANSNDDAVVTPEQEDDADERDRMGYNLFINAEYQLGRRTSVFGDVNYNLNDFETDDESGSRDSQIIDTLAGVNLELGQTASLSMGIGVSQVFFEDPDRDNTQAINGELDLAGVIDLNRVTTLNLSLSNSTGVTTVEDAALVTTTALRSSLTRTLTRTSTVQASLGLTRSEFLDTARTDHDIAAQLAYNRTLTPNTSLTARYRYSQRFADEQEDEFRRHVVSLGFSASF